MSMSIKIEFRYAILTSLCTLLWLILEYTVGLHDNYIAWHPYVTMLAIIIPIITYRLALIEKLEENIHKLQHEIDAVKLVDEKTMWLNDLNNLEKEYKIWLDDITASEAKTKKVVDKGKTKKARKSKV